MKTFTPAQRWTVQFNWLLGFRLRAAIAALEAIAESDLVPGYVRKNALSIAMEIRDFRQSVESRREMFKEAYLRRKRCP